jgi:hypothetical protein
MSTSLVVCTTTRGSRIVLIGILAIISLASSFFLQNQMFFSGE